MCDVNIPWMSKTKELGVWKCRNIDGLLVVSVLEGLLSDGALWTCPNLKGGQSEGLSRNIGS